MSKEIPLETVLETNGHGHKDMAGAVIDTNQFLMDLEAHGYTINFDPSEQGGFILKNGNEPAAYIKSPYWRAEVNDPNLTVNDIRPVFVNNKESVALANIETGAELEIFVWDPAKSDSAPVMGKESPIPKWLEEHGNGNSFIEEDALFPELNEQTRKIGFSDELLNSCIELNFHHSPDGRETAMSMAWALKKLAQGVKEQGWLLTPTASMPHKPLKVEDTNQNPYVQRIAMDYMGWDNVQHFIGSSWQVHVEMTDLKSALKSINLYQQISPLMYGLSLSGPFAHGQVNPNLKEIYQENETDMRRLDDTETYENLNCNEWLSSRYPGRWRGSPSGGVYTLPAPENPVDFFEIAEAGLRDNNENSPTNIPSPARAMGHHTDRIRIDIGQYGTLEISNQDTFGGHVTKLAANQEFTRVLIWKLQVLSRGNRLEELSQKYPDLFSYPVTTESLRQAHLASIEVAKKGMDAQIVGSNGTEYTARELFWHLMKFVNEPLSLPDEGIEYHGLPQGIYEETYRSSLDPKAMYEQYRDSNGITSTQGFYESGIGTLSHWMKQRAKELMDKGLNPEEAIKNTMTDLGESYHQHLQKINSQTIIDLFS